MTEQAYWIAIGDIHDNHGRVADIPGLEEARGVIVTGDLTIRGGADQARRVLDAIRARNPRILAQIGNMDKPEVTAMLRAEGVNLHTAVVPLDQEFPDLVVMGVGTSTPTPFGTPSEVGDEQLAAWLAQGWEEAKKHARVILVAHDPPRGTKLDLLPSGQHVGSRAVREFIELRQPVLCLSGHIHESRAEDRLGRTRLFNPGQLLDGGYVRVEIDKENVTARLERF